MAVFNGEKYLEEQFESIASQTYKDWRLIIRDDCSTDNSFALSKVFAKKMGSKKVILYRNNTPSGSAKKNFAKLFKDAKNSKYVMCCDQDDVWKENKIEKSVEAMKELERYYGRRTPFLVHSDVEVVDSSMNEIASSMFKMSHLLYEPALSQLIVQNNVTGCTMFMNRPLVKGIADIIDRDEIIMHDYLAALYAAVFGKIGVIKEPLLYYRQHDNNSVGAKNSNSSKYLFSRLSEGKAAYREEMYKSQKQIGFLARFFSEKMFNEDKKLEYRLFVAYGSLSKDSQWERFSFYHNNNAWKSGFIRKIIQCIWG